MIADALGAKIHAAQRGRTEVADDGIVVHAENGDILRDENP